MHLHENASLVIALWLGMGGKQNITFSADEIPETLTSLKRQVSQPKNVSHSEFVLSIWI